MNEFCPYINDCYRPEEIKMPKCTDGYEMCHEWYRRLNGLEEEVLGVGAPMVDITKSTRFIKYDTVK